MRILGLNVKQNKMRFTIVLQRYYKTKNTEFQINKADFDDIIRNCNIFHFIKDLESLDILIEGLTRELFNIKPSISVNKFVNDLFDWVDMFDEL